MGRADASVDRPLADQHPGSMEPSADHSSKPDPSADHPADPSADQIDSKPIRASRSNRSRTALRVRTKPDLPHTDPSAAHADHSADPAAEFPAARPCVVPASTATVERSAPNAQQTYAAAPDAPQTTGRHPPVPRIVTSTAASAGPRSGSDALASASALLLDLHAADTAHLDAAESDAVLSLTLMFTVGSPHALAPSPLPIALASLPTPVHPAPSGALFANQPTSSLSPRAVPPRLPPPPFDSADAEARIDAVGTLHGPVNNQEPLAPIIDRWRPSTAATAYEHEPIQPQPHDLDPSIDQHEFAGAAIGLPALPPSASAPPHSPQHPPFSTVHESQIAAAEGPSFQELGSGAQAHIQPYLQSKNEYIHAQASATAAPTEVESACIPSEQKQILRSEQDRSSDSFYGAMHNQDPQLPSTSSPHRLHQNIDYEHNLNFSFQPAQITQPESMQTPAAPFQDQQQFPSPMLQPLQTRHMSMQQINMIYPPRLLPSPIHPQQPHSRRRASTALAPIPPSPNISATVSPLLHSHPALASNLFDQNPYYHPCAVREITPENTAISTPEPELSHTNHATQNNQNETSTNPANQNDAMQVDASDQATTSALSQTSQASVAEPVSEEFKITTLSPTQTSLSQQPFSFQNHFTAFPVHSAVSLPLSTMSMSILTSAPAHESMQTHISIPSVSQSLQTLAQHVPQQNGYHRLQSQQSVMPQLKHAQENMLELLHHPSSFQVDRRYSIANGHTFAHMNAANAKCDANGQPVSTASSHSHVTALSDMNVSVGVAGHTDLHANKLDASYRSQSEFAHGWMDAHTSEQTTSMHHESGTQMQASLSGRTDTVISTSSGSGLSENSPSDTPQSHQPFAVHVDNMDTSDMSGSGKHTSMLFPRQRSLPLGAPGRPYVPAPSDLSRNLPTCQICGQSFTRVFNLNSHLKSHNNVKPFGCEHCGMTFTRRHDLNRHSRQHLQDRPFSCDQCGRNFLRKDALKRHQRMHQSKGTQCVSLQRDQPLADDTAHPL